MILVDTSVWIEHLRSGNAPLGDLLMEGKVLTHPFVIGELACGNLGNRQKILSLLEALPSVPVAQHQEVMHLLTARLLYGRGLGWVDLHLLSSALISGCSFWTLDKSLHRIAAQLKIAL